MLHPSMSELLTKIDNRYLLVNVTAKRARELAEEAEDAELSLAEKPVKLALDDIMYGRIETCEPEELEAIEAAKAAAAAEKAAARAAAEAAAAAALAEAAARELAEESDAENAADEVAADEAEEPAKTEAPAESSEQ